MFFTLHLQKVSISSTIFGDLKETHKLCISTYRSAVTMKNAQVYNTE